MRKMGMNEAKAGGVEVYSARDYLQSRRLWGPGGILCHELSHVFHDKWCPGGYDCVAIREVRRVLIEPLPCLNVRV